MQIRKLRQRVGQRHTRSPQGLGRITDPAELFCSWVYEYRAGSEPMAGSVSYWVTQVS